MKTTRTLTCLLLALATLVLGFAVPQLAGAQANLENPAPGSFQSGIGIVSGWKCTAGALTFTIDGGPSSPLSYGSSRGDTQNMCGDVNNGFIAENNWNLAGDGQHTIRIYDDGVQFAQATFTVTTLRTEYLTGVNGTCTLQNFPSTGDRVTVRWEENLQNFVIEEACPPLQGCCSHHEGVCSCRGGAVFCCDGTQSPTCGFE